MTLKEYLKLHDLRPEDFAEIAGVSKGGVYKWMNGERYPRLPSMVKIAKATDGAVMPNDFQAEQIQSS